MMVGRYGSWVLAIALAGCVSSDASTRLARELVVPYRSSVVAAAFKDEILVDQDTIAAMRAIVARRQEVLRAVVQLQRGVHPYTVLSFVEAGSRTRVVATAMFWGDLEEKRVGSTSAGDVERMVEAAVESFDCTQGPATRTLLGPALVYWRDGSQVTCQGPMWSETAAPLIDIVVPIIDSLQPIYETRP